MSQNYKHNWTIRDYKILFTICNGYEGDEKQDLGNPARKR